MLTAEDAREMSATLTEPNLFPQIREEITRTLLDYYKELLYRPPHPPIPTVRRMW